MSDFEILEPSGSSLWHSSLSAGSAAASPYSYGVQNANVPPPRPVQAPSVSPANGNRTGPEVVAASLPTNQPGPSHNPTPPSRGGHQLGAADFLNQRDNEFDEEGCNGDILCTPTSATMAILGRISLDAFFQRAMTLLADKGSAAPSDRSGI